MGEAKRRKEYLQEHPEIAFVPKGKSEEIYDESGVVISNPENYKPKRQGKFTDNLLKDMSYKHTVKDKKEMNEEELKAWNSRRNKSRCQEKRLNKMREKFSKALSHRKLTNTCRRQRLKSKHSETKVPCHDEHCDH